MENAVFVSAARARKIALHFSKHRMASKVRPSYVRGELQGYHVLVEGEIVNETTAACLTPFLDKPTTHVAPYLALVQ
jgi:hypothetical protein